MAFLIAVAALAAWVGSLLQCRLAAHQYTAIEVDPQSDLAIHHSRWKVAFRMMFRRPRSLDGASKSEEALLNAQGWLWVNFGAALVAGASLTSATGEYRVLFAFIPITLAIVVAMLRGEV